MGLKPTSIITERGDVYEAVLEPGMDGYIVAHCSSLKGCVSQGRTEEDALCNIKEAIELYLETDF